MDGYARESGYCPEFERARGWVSILSKDASALGHKYYLTAREDLAVGNELIANVHYAAAVFHFQQAIEKIVKAIAAPKGEFISGSETAAWLKLEISEEFEGTKEIVEFCRGLEEATNRARYPSRQKNQILTPMESFSEKESRRIQEKTNQIYLRLGKYLVEKYSPSWKSDIEEAKDSPNASK